MNVRDERINCYKATIKQLEETIRHREYRMDCHNEQATKHKATIATLEAKVTDIDNNRTWYITDRLYYKRNSETLQELYNEEQKTSKKQEARIELLEKQKKGLEEQAKWTSKQLNCTTSIWLIKSSASSQQRQQPRRRSPSHTHCTLLCANSLTARQACKRTPALPYCHFFL